MWRNREKSKAMLQKAKRQAADRETACPVAAAVAEERVGNGAHSLNHATQLNSTLRTELTHSLSHSLMAHRDAAGGDKCNIGIWNSEEDPKSEAHRHS